SYECAGLPVLPGCHPVEPCDSLEKNGGEGGIRTPDTLLRCTPLAGERLRPLGHLSATRGVLYPSKPRLQSLDSIKIEKKSMAWFFVLLLLDALVDFLAMYCDFLGCIDANAHLIALHAQHGHGDIVTDHQGLSHAASQNKHSFSPF